MPTVPHRPHPSVRHALVAATTALALICAMPAASADPIDPQDLAGGQQGHDHAEPLGLLGDHFAEALVVPEDPFVLEQDAARGPLAPATEPLAWVGTPPDLDEMPAEWLKETPAEVIEPATTEELMSADSGYLAQYQESDGSVDASSGPATAELPDPPTKWLPDTLDAASGWQYSYSCDPNNKPGTVAFGELVSSHYDRPTFYTSRACIAGDNSQHYDGRAVDWPMDVYNADDKAIGDAVAQWLTANDGEMARRFGVMSVIWNKRSWYITAPDRWFDYTGPSPHTDHLHISFSWDGAMKRTSWWTGSPVSTIDQGTCRVYSGQYAPRYTGRRTSDCPTNLPLPPDSPYPVVLPNAVNSYVTIAQEYLGFTGSDVDGSFGPMTLTALLDYQRAYAAPVTGVLDNASWATMIANEQPEDPTPPSDDVIRISGANRYATAAALASDAPTGGYLFVTTGANYPDALSASARAGSMGAPVLLTKRGEIPAETKEQLQRIKPWRIFVVGGTGVISPEVRTALRSYTGTGGTQRLSGTDRFETAAAVARQFGTSVPVVYVATGGDYPDAMTGAARAAHNDGPMLLTKPTSVPAATAAAMDDINPQRVVVIGGQSAVSDSVAQQLAGMTTTGSVQRVAGANRYETAANLAAYYPTGLDVVYVATGSNYPDALAGSARAGSQGGPMLLTTRWSLPEETEAALQRLRPQRIVVVGGTDAVSDTVLALLRSYTS